MKDQIEPINESPQLDQAGTETLLALLSSKTKTEAAEKLKIDRTTLYQRIDRYGLAKHLEAIPKRALQTLQMGSELAAETMINKLSGHQGLEAAKEILDRVGLTGDKQQNLTQINIGADMGVKFEKDVDT